MPYTHVVALADPSALNPHRAEYSALDALRRSGRLGAAPRVTLLHVDSEEARLAAASVASQLARDFQAGVEVEPVGELDAEDRGPQHRRLGAFMRRVADALRRGDLRSTCFAPVGGTQGTTTLGYVVSAFLRVPMVALDGTSQVLQEVPWVPIRIDEDALQDAAPVVRRAVRGVAMGDLAPEHRTRAQRLPWLFEVGEGGPDAVVHLSAFGHFLRSEERYAPVVGPRVLVAPDAMDALARADRRFVWRQVDDLLWRLEDEDVHRGVLRQEVSLGHRDAEWHLFEGARGPSGVFRASYRWYPALDTLALRQVWTDPDRYVREARRAEAFHGAPGDMQPLERP